MILHFNARLVCFLTFLFAIILFHGELAFLLEYLYNLNILLAASILLSYMLHSDINSIWAN